MSGGGVVVGKGVWRTGMSRMLLRQGDASKMSLMVLTIPTCSLVRWSRLPVQFICRQRQTRAEGGARDRFLTGKTNTDKRSERTNTVLLMENRAAQKSCFLFLLFL